MGEPFDWLPEEAAEHWRRLAETAPQGLYTAADRDVMAVFVNSAFHYRVATEMVRAEGVVIETAEGRQRHPAAMVMNQMSAAMRWSADALALSPAARARVEVKGDDKPETELGKLVGL